MQLKYDNITISGGVGVGTSTLATHLKPFLIPYNWSFFSGGEFMRDYAIKNNLIQESEKAHHDASVYTDDFDREVDYGMQKRLTEEKHLVLEAWLSGFFAKDIKTTLKILLICSNEAIRIDRVVNREDMTVDEAKNYIKHREEVNSTKWKRLYGDHNFFDPKYFDLVIDTYSSGPMETVGAVLDTLGYDQRNIIIEKK
jgi:cytidylate kinase